MQLLRKELGGNACRGLPGSLLVQCSTPTAGRWASARVRSRSCSQEVIVKALLVWAYDPGLLVCQANVPEWQTNRTITVVLFMCRVSAIGTIGTRVSNSFLCTVDTIYAISFQYFSGHAFSLASVFYLDEKFSYEAKLHYSTQLPPCASCTGWIGRYVCVCTCAHVQGLGFLIA